MEKLCCKCKTLQPLDNFGKLKSSKDGLKYDCKSCIKEYRNRPEVKEHIKKKNKEYNEENKETLLLYHREKWEKNKEKYNEHRKEYRARPEVKEHIKQKNKEYLPVRKEKIKERRKTDTNFQLSEILRSKIHKMIKGKETSYQKYIGCDIEFFKKWIEYRFDENMEWDNLGTYWQIDHILPISKFNFNNDNECYICFNWTNLRPLECSENRSKWNKIELHSYFNNIVSVVRFNKKYSQFLGYQNINESLYWLRNELRYGNNSTDEAKAEMGNPQPSS